MSISPIIFVLPKDPRSKITPFKFKDKLLEGLQTELSKPNTQVLVADYFVNDKEDLSNDILARVLFTFNTRHPHSISDETVDINIENDGDIVRYHLIPSSTVIGYDPHHVGNEETNLKSKAFKAVANSTFRAVNGDISIATFNCAEPPNSVNDAIEVLPYSRYSLVSNRLLPDFREFIGGKNPDFLPAITKKGEYTEIAPSKHPFGLGIFPTADFETASIFYTTFQNALGEYIKSICSA